jgi:hypothetical protein
MLTFWVIIILSSVAALGIFWSWCCWRAGRETGYEIGRADAYAEVGRAQKQERAEWAGPRHAKSQPRADLPLQPAAATSSGPEPTPEDRGSWFGQPPIGLTLPPGVTLVSPIDTALLADPSPAPAVNGTADTGTMPKLRIPSGTTDTGELRAIESIGDAMVRRIENGELV